jgi:V8-like Glu-specific endopeptidase
MCDRHDTSTETVDATGRNAADRPNDPLYPLLPQALDALRRQVRERAEREGVRVSDDEYSRILETICGVIDDSQAVEVYDGTLGVTTAFVNAHQAPVGQIQWNNDLATHYTNPGNVNGARFCTGTLITNNLFLTAGHCFDQTGGGWNRPRINGTNNIISSAEIATRMHVNFNFQNDPSGNPRPVTEVAITALVEYRLGGLDFAIVRLAGSPGTTFGRTGVSTTDAVAGDMLCVMGHPAGVPKRVEAGPALAPSGNQIRYDDIDTLGGSSGAGVLRASDGLIVGVHTNGGCTAASPNGSNANTGQRIAAVIAASPTLQGLTQPSLKFRDDLPKLKFKDDHVTIKVLVDGTKLKFKDDHVTIKFADDHGTLKFIDDHGTGILQDKGPGTLKFIDDKKHPALDKHPGSDMKHPALDGHHNPIGPHVNPGHATRPLILQTPHHSQAWMGTSGAEATAQSGAAEYESALADLHQAIEQRHQELAELDQIFSQLLAEYQQAGGQIG